MSPPPISFGNGDPQIPRASQQSHDRAQSLGLDSYQDPESGYSVYTAAFLHEQGKCCGNGCRHCPFDAIEQKRAGRSRIRPSVPLPRDR